MKPNYFKRRHLYNIINKHEIGKLVHYYKKIYFNKTKALNKKQMHMCHCEHKNYINIERLKKNTFKNVIINLVKKDKYQLKSKIISNFYYKF